MSDLIAIPTVEQINLEHQLANSKANEAVQHATNCGLMLLQVKASLQHGEWLPWLNGEIESGRLNVKVRQTQKYMQLASNTHRSAYLEDAPSIRAALELLSDKESTEQQGELIDGEAERQARIAAEQKAEAERQARLQAEQDKATEQQRNKEWADQNKANRDKIKALELDLSAAQNQPAPKPIVVEKKVIPDDYESAKQQAIELQSQTQALQKQLADLQKQQTKLVSDQVKAKLQGYQSELDKLEEQKRTIEGIVDRKKAYLDSLDSEVKRIETHQNVINGVRLELISLAAFLNDLDPMNDQDTIKKWLALAQMNEEASKTIRWVFGDRDESHGRELRVVA